MIFQPLGLFVKTFTADDKYSLRNIKDLLQAIQIQCSLKLFSQYFAQFLESTSSFKHFDQSYDPRRLCIFEITDCERHG